MSEPSLPTIKRLFAESCNACAMASCANPLVDADGVVVGRICHIHSASDKGPRANKALTPEQRHAYENLLLLCSPHHDAIDKDVPAWPAERLLEIKRMAAATRSSTSATLGEAEAERVAKQLAHTYQTYTAGIMIGSIIAENVQIAHGNIVNNAAPLTESERIVARIRELLGKTGPFAVRLYHVSPYKPHDRVVPDTEIIHVLDVTEHDDLELQRSTRGFPERCYVSSSRLSTFAWDRDRYSLHVNGCIEHQASFRFVPISAR